MAKVSIIITIYNVENYLKRCLDSIISQTLKDIEIVLVNDGSTDSSGAICDEYKDIDSRIVVVHKKNGGVSSARNAGVKASTGEFIGFVDSDDFIAENMYEALVDLAEKYSSDIVASEYIRFEKEEDLQKEAVKLEEIIHEFNNAEALENLFKEYHEKDKKFRTVVCDKIYKRELFDGLLFPEGKIYEEAYVLYKVFYRAKKVIHTNRALYYYYKREGSITNSHDTVNEDVVKAYDDWRDIFRFINTNVKSLSSMVAQKYITKNLSIYRLIVGKDEFKEYQIKIYNDLKVDFKELIFLKYSRRVKLELIRFILFKK